MTTKNILDDEEVRRDIERSRAELLVQAMSAIQIHGDRYRDVNCNATSAASRWFVVNESRAPGDLISEHTSLKDATLARAHAILVWIGITEDATKVGHGT
jgi:hypothetical protein